MTPNPPPTAPSDKQTVLKTGLYLLSLLFYFLFTPQSFLVGSVVKNLPANAGDLGSITGLGRSRGEGNGKPLEYSCQGNPLDRGGWQAAVHEVAKESDMT